MSDLLSDAQNMIDALEDYASEHENFNMTFVKSVEKQMTMKGIVSDKQHSALKNIVDKFELDY